MKRIDVLYQPKKELPKKKLSGLITKKVGFSSIVTAGPNAVKLNCNGMRFSLSLTRFCELGPIFLNSPPQN